MAECNPTKSSLVSSVVQDGGKVAIFCCPRCKGNQVVALSDWSTGVSTMFPAVDVAGLGQLFLLTVYGVEEGYHKSGDCVDKSVPSCVSMDAFEDMFSGFVGLAAKLLDVHMSCLYYAGTEESVDSGVVVDYGEESEDEELPDCGSSQCFPVFSFDEVRSFGVVERNLGSIDVEAGGGKFIEAACSFASEVSTGGGE